MTFDLSTAQWYKSTYCSGSRDCVEVAHLDGGSVGVRDSKAPAAPALVFTPAEWDTFLTRTREATATGNA
ncbi:DUF397 domain-containing protein [Nocardia bovistercoris]|uniref:DUF397 domain-containing protein n=1 Tax=Nocardia bovistercoris TaxID=2785916 RepID=A0A931I6I3_9NOCA|nr:DUF397 domain-containing protein [Nocardia bovistercoris]MBH0775784.1 DUF397 domain-containing protein [Nocardia bovistercoris]